jgi:HD-GYP domain-containing protein (c-di-GMP phosphodiesterase class II)
MSARSVDEHAADVAFWLAAAFINRRLYAADNPLARQNLERLVSELTVLLDRPGVNDFSLALLSGGVSLSGRPLLAPPEGVAKLASHMRQRGLEILTVTRGATLAEIETLLALLNLDAAELTAVDVDRWLRDRGAQHVSIKHIELQDQKVVRSMRELYANGKEALGEEFARVTSRGAIELGAMAELSSTMLDLVLNSEVPVATMVALRGRDDFTFVHSMNVSVLASAQAATLGLDEDMIRTVGIAGLVHDLGKTVLPESVLGKKEGEHTAEELQLLQTHAGEGARILLRTHGGAGLEAVVAAEHHLPYTEDPHLASQIVAIADAFDAIRSLRPFTERRALRSALRFMLEHMKRRLNPYLLQRFCLMCGMYMPGDRVQLTTGEIAQVVQTNVELGAKPTLEVVDPADGRAPTGTVVDLSQENPPTSIQPDPAPAFANLTIDAVDALA